MHLSYGCKDDISDWMSLVEKARPIFPGLETAEKIAEHRQTVLRFMERSEALCVRESGTLAGVLLFSSRRNMICFLAVLPEFRRKGVASMMLREALGKLDKSRDITVSTFLEYDPRGKAPRALYKSFGFVEGEFIEEFGCPNQVFTLKAR